MKRSRLRPRSKKRIALMVARAKFVAQFLAANPRCQAQFAGCWGKATQVNELKRRSHGGKIVPGAEAAAQGQRWHALCGPCHDRITVNPTWAKENGWEVR